MKRSDLRKVLAATSVTLLWVLGCNERAASSTAGQKPAEARAADKPTTQAAPQGDAAPKPSAANLATTADMRAACERACRAPLELGCKSAATCVASCLAMASVGSCAKQLSSFYECLASQPKEHWECLEDGTGAIRDGYCEAEQAAFAACLGRVNP